MGGGQTGSQSSNVSELHYVFILQVETPSRIYEIRGGVYW